ncbi:4-hydroxy-tetrahydrodipicolinate reductase [Halovivax cerinus]|uniref:4-hydroxy-tetrahydrodipicolinate reductase n=1 Tax=Halovivax cerinus TaxID=1487865 RepID=A0ABD5NU14_9EURY|nr:4-hydroxy-tetrahydrodipicolinate reductase [Halovivax cerinus]
MTATASDDGVPGVLRLGVTGATGRMGREVLAAAAERPAVEVVFAVARSPDERVAETDVDPDADLDALAVEREPHAVVDFTAPNPATRYAAACADAGVPFVTGTTGFDASQREALRAASESTPLLHAANFSRGVAVLDHLVAEAVRRLPGYDVELVETHHNGKRDAPSGTANRLVETIETTRSTGDGAPERVHGRAGDAPREPDEIGVHSVRAGSIAGEHELLLAGDGEDVTLTHRAGDRRIFAAGALDAAAWLAGRDPGWYDFAEVIEA